MQDKKQFLNFKKIKSIRGRTVILCNGYKYHFCTKTTSNTRWRCSERSCASVLVLFDDNSGFLTRPNSHENDMQMNNALICKEKMATWSVTNELPPRAIIATATKNLSHEEAKKLPKFKSYSRTIQNIRKRNLVDSCSHEEEIPNIFKHTLREENFIQFDNGVENENRVLIISTTKNLEYLRDAKFGFVTVHLKWSRLVFISYMFSRVKLLTHLFL
jgi:hypothetical protein